jgi:hypothetical protein
MRVVWERVDDVRGWCEGVRALPLALAVVAAN